MVSLLLLESSVLNRPVPSCSKEPRIKGSFKGLALIYGEVRPITRKIAPLTFYQIIFVLHQVVDRMDNMLHLRTAYGSGPLEQHNVCLSNELHPDSESLTVL